MAGIGQSSVLLIYGSTSPFGDSESPIRDPGSPIRDMESLTSMLQMDIKGIAGRIPALIPEARTWQGDTLVVLRGHLRSAG